MRKSWYYPIFRDLAILLLLNGIGYLLLGQVRIMDQLLSPSGESSTMGLFAAFVFTLIRLFLILFAPGWVLARLYLSPRNLVLEPAPQAETGKSAPSGNGPETS